MRSSLLTKVSVALMILAFMVSVVTHLVAYELSGISNLETLAEKGVLTDARVKNIEDDNRAAIHFVYEVNGMQYSGIGSANKAGYNSDEIKIGDKIGIYYVPDEPSIGYFFDPKNVLSGAYFTLWLFTILAPIGSIILPGLIVGILIRGLKTKNS